MGTNPTTSGCEVKKHNVSETLKPSHLKVIATGFRIVCRRSLRDQQVHRSVTDNWANTYQPLFRSLRFLYSFVSPSCFFFTGIVHNSHRFPSFHRRLFPKPFVFLFVPYRFVPVVLFSTFRLLTLILFSFSHISSVSGIFARLWSSAVLTLPQRS